MLPPDDLDYLRLKSPDFQVTVEGGMHCVVLPGFPLPVGFTMKESDLLVRLPAGYPDVKPDMWWFCPALKRADGKQIPATDVRESHLGRSWQRWSRHLNNGQWRPGIDSIASYLSLVSRELDAAAARSAA